MRLSLRKKIILLAVIPLCGLFYFSALEIFSNFETRKESQKITELVHLSTKISALVHEIQKERAFSSGFLADGGESFKEDLFRQMESVDEGRHGLDSFLADFDQSKFGDHFEEEYDKMVSKLDQIVAHRTKILDLSVDGRDSIEFYSSVIDSALHLISYVSYLHLNMQISPTINLYLNFLKEKEYTGIERAIGTIVLAHGGFQKGEYEKYLLASISQEVSRDIHRDTIEITGFSDFFKEKTADPVFAEVARMRSVLIEKSATGNFGIDSKTWLDAMTTKINILKEMEDVLTDSLIAKSSSIARDTWRWMLVSILLVIVLFLAIILFIFYTILSIFRPIKKIQEGVRSIAAGEMSTQIEIESNDEFGELANSFNQMVASLKKSNSDLAFYSKNLEKIVAEKTNKLQEKLLELERFNKLVVGRELRMVEMKNEIDELKKERSTIS